MFLSSRVRKFHNTYFMFLLSRYFLFYYQVPRTAHNKNLCLQNQCSSKVTFLKKEHSFPSHGLGHLRVGSKPASTQTKDRPVVSQWGFLDRITKIIPFESTDSETPSVHSLIHRLKPSPLFSHLILLFQGHEPGLLLEPAWWRLLCCPVKWHGRQVLSRKGKARVSTFFSDSDVWNYIFHLLGDCPNQQATMPIWAEQLCLSAEVAPTFTEGHVGGEQSRVPQRAAKQGPVFPASLQLLFLCGFCLKQLLVTMNRRPTQEMLLQWLISLSLILEN